MNEDQKALARACNNAAHDGTKTFPEIVGALIAAGFESYAVDFRRATAIYYLPDGDSIEVGMHRPNVPVAPAFDTSVIQAAIRDAQNLVPGYTYAGFCDKVASAGCAGYLVSFPGRRAL